MHMRARYAPAQMGLRGVAILRQTSHNARSVQCLADVRHRARLQAESVTRR
jgi:hypothetical protein